MEQEELMDLPPGFRFHPTDEELITHYLSNKVRDPRFTARAIGDVDLNKCEPWDLPYRAKMGEKEWYFFCLNDRKYPTGLRTNRATASGYWKATGKDKEIHRGKSLVGMKKTLVFYLGRAPKGVKSNWVMHEFRLEGNYTLTRSSKNEWVICKVFYKTSGVKKVLGCDELDSNSNVPQITNICYTTENKGCVSDSTHVTCFSNSMEGQRGHDQLFANYYNTPLPSDFDVCEASPSLPNFTGMSLPGQIYGNMQYPDGSMVQMLEWKPEKEMISASQETGITSDVNPEISSVVSNNNMCRLSFDGLEDPCSSSGPLQLEDLWKY